eukprot:TRINITY_DN11629_c1_g2_i1.p1 TRINITY_DN11629_c1_g2~~TRINITY_DN11629_c1_g2_i1.p1  ORF type:complete len:238 (-),score=50.56 TRINITY_DN11629_c1_g2_i1:161-874(-)
MAVGSKILIFSMLSIISSIAALKTQVKVYEGPTECNDDDKISKGKLVKTYYTGTIDQSSPTGIKGSQFDSNVGQDPLDFESGTEEVIPGMDQGLMGLCKGAKVTLIIPHEEGYGEEGDGNELPGRATLNFDVTIFDVLPNDPNRKRQDEEDEEKGDEENEETGDEENEEKGDEDKEETDPADLFKEADADGDGKLSQAEVVEIHGEESKPIFAKYDKNGDGFLSLEELESGFKQSEL